MTTRSPAYGTPPGDADAGEEAGEARADDAASEGSDMMPVDSEEEEARLLRDYCVITIRLTRDYHVIIIR